MDLQHRRGDVSLERGLIYWPAGVNGHPNDRSCGQAGIRTPAKDVPVSGLRRAQDERTRGPTDLLSTKCE
jgi:hypothetical protein